MREVMRFGAMLLLAAQASMVFAENSVTVQSKQVAPNDANVAIGILLANDAFLRAALIPLEIREITPGAFVTRLRMSYGERNSCAQPWEIGVTHYAAPDGSCASPQGEGYATPTHQQDYGWHHVNDPPEGLLFDFPRGVGLCNFPPGVDTVGSFMLYVDVTGNPGTFEIDTTCIDPGVSLEFVLDDSSPSTPNFTKGVITIVNCDCPYPADLDSTGFIDSVDLAVEIDVVFFGEVDVQDPFCPATRSDFNADGFADAVDVAELIDHVFFGQPGPVDPCGP